MPYKFKFVLSFACLIISTIINIYQPLVLGNLIDYITDKKWSYIPRLLILTMLLFLAISILNNIYIYINGIVSNKIQIQMRKNIFNNILSLSTKEFETTQNGEFITNLEDDVDAISRLLTDKITIIIDIFTVIFMAIFLFKLNIKLAIITIINLPVSSVIFMYFGKKISKLENDNKLGKDKYNNFIQENINGFNTIKILNGKNIMNKKFFP